MKVLKATFYTTIISGVMLLSGCSDNRISMYEMCNTEPDICRDVETEGWCKHQRAELITRRYQSSQNVNDQDNTYRTLLAWQDFNKCIGVAANITRKTVTDRTSTRSKAFLVSINEIEKLEQQTAASKFPQLLYYHWVQDGKGYRINQLLKLDRSNKLASTELQLMMASYYAKVDKSKAIKAQYKALSYLNSSDNFELDNQVFASLATSFFQQKNYPLAYVWTKVAEQSGLKASAATSLQRHLKTGKYDLEQLEDVAERTYNSIKSQQFVAPPNSL